MLCLCCTEQGSGAIRAGCPRAVKALNEAASSRRTTPGRSEAHAGGSNWGIGRALDFTTRSAQSQCEVHRDDDYVVLISSLSAQPKRRADLPGNVGDTAHDTGTATRRKTALRADSFEFPRRARLTLQALSGPRPVAGPRQQLRNTAGRPSDVPRSPARAGQARDVAAVRDTPSPGRVRPTRNILGTRRARAAQPQHLDAQVLASAKREPGTAVGEGRSNHAQRTLTCGNSLRADPAETRHAHNHP